MCSMGDGACDDDDGDADDEDVDVQHLEGEGDIGVAWEMVLVMTMIVMMMAMAKTMRRRITLKVTSVCGMGDGACDDDDGDVDGDDEDDGEDHLEGDICVRHGRLRIKVFEQQLDVRTAFSPVPRTRALHFVINRDFFVIVLYSLNKILVSQTIPEKFKKKRLWQHRLFN